MLSPKQVQNVCMQGQGAKQCRYLDENVDHNWGDCCCLKQIKNQKQAIDARVQKHIDQCKKNNQDPKKGYVGIGDNCSGYPYLKKITQGYDVKP